jgi:hypothetical protein
MSDNPKFYAPKTLEEALANIKEWLAFRHEFPGIKNAGGVTITAELMLDLVTRIQLLEENNRAR